MRRTGVCLAAALVVVLVSGCAAQPETEDEDAIADFIAAAELAPLDAVRLGFVKQWNFSQLNEEYVVLRARDDYYLVEFRRRCRELNQNSVTPDIRYDSNILRPGIDTIRGCVIDRMFAIDKGQAEELEHIGKKP